jgi:hypothetical protein
MRLLLGGVFTSARNRPLLWRACPLSLSAVGVIKILKPRIRRWRFNLKREGMTLGCLIPPSVDLMIDLSDSQWAVKRLFKEILVTQRNRNEFFISFTLALSLSLLFFLPCPSSHQTDRALIATDVNRSILRVIIKLRQLTSGFGRRVSKEQQIC